MMKHSLFGAQEREAKLSKLGDALEVMERQSMTRPRARAVPVVAVRRFRRK